MGRCWYAILCQFMGNTADAHIQLDKHMENRETYRSLFRVKHIERFCFISPLPAIRGKASAYRQTEFNARLPATISIFQNLFSFRLSAPGQNLAYQLPHQSIAVI